MLIQFNILHSFALQSLNIHIYIIRLFGSSSDKQQRKKKEVLKLISYYLCSNLILFGNALFFSLTLHRS